MTPNREACSGIMITAMAAHGGFNGLLGIFMGQPFSLVKTEDFRNSLWLKISHLWYPNFEPQ